MVELVGIEPTQNLGLQPSALPTELQLRKTGSNYNQPVSATTYSLV